MLPALPLPPILGDPIPLPALPIITSAAPATRDGAKPAASEPAVPGVPLPALLPAVPGLPSLPALPVVGLPDAAVPDVAVPDGGVPDGAVPDGAVPDAPSPVIAEGVAPAPAVSFADLMGQLVRLMLMSMGR